MKERSKEKSKEKSKDMSKRVSSTNSISTQIILLVALVVILAVIGCVFSAMPQAKKSMIKSNKDYMLSMADAAVDLVEKGGDGSTLTEKQYANLLSGLDMEGIASSYTYLVDSTGNMLYHPTASKIGKQVENDVILGVVAQIKAGTIPQSQVVSYKFNGTIKYAAYSITSNKQIAVVSADESDILAPYYAMVNKIIVTSISSLIICMIIGYLISRLITKPIKKLTVVIDDTAKLDFRSNEIGEKICNKKDETGAMARAISLMRNNLIQMVDDITDASKRITSSVNELQGVTNVVNSMCTDNSATSEELAAGMEETSATTETINNNLGEVKTRAKDIAALATDGTTVSKEVMERAQNLKTTTISASNKTKDIYNSVKQKSDEAIEGAKSVDKINELTSTIMAISSQTGLLALNASIEAARAGEAGRGFSVVATEIGNLSDQTSTAVADINKIIEEVNNAVKNMSDCLEETTDFLESTVLTEYKQFEQVSEQYSEDADVFKDNMSEVHDSIEHLTEAIESIAESVSGISNTIGESTVGVGDIAEKTSNMVQNTNAAYTMVSECNKCVDDLNSVVDRFILK